MTNNASFVWPDPLPTGSTGLPWPDDATFFALAAVVYGVVAIACWVVWRIDRGRRPVGDASPWFLPIFCGGFLSGVMGLLWWVFSP